MCGIGGVISLDGRPVRATRLKPMMDAVAHRGPDDAGYVLLGATGQERERAFSDAAFSHLAGGLAPIDSPEAAQSVGAAHWKLALGHRRLSVIDLSQRAHQPMALHGRGLWITYNGELYNFRELRAELKALGHAFGSESDTEVLLAAYTQWGLDCLARLNGMFAFALWDGHAGRLFLVRDRYGVKPLYYAIRDGVLVFGSEVRSIFRYFEQRPQVDLLALNEYLSFQNVFSDRTLFAGVRMLPAGHWMEVGGENGPRARRYWDFDFREESDDPEPVLREQLTELIRGAVRRQCVSDVPLGSYLSGGMDSGTVAALAAETYGRIATFTAGFDLSEALEHELGFDERALAEKMARALQTEHYECVLHSGDLRALMDRVILHLEDPRIGQCYPNIAVAKLASRFVKVVMSGTGGDELFGGYPWRYAAAVGRTSDDYVMNYYQYWKRLVGDEDKPRIYAPEVGAALSRHLGGGDNSFGRHTFDTFCAVFPRPVRAATVEEQVNHSLYFECKTFLHGLMVVEDKLSMAYGLETRVPFLDNELVEFACRIPVKYKIADLARLRPLDENLPRKKSYYVGATDSGKSILRAAMERILPPEITGARKQGFSAPDESWFRGSAESYVRERVLGSESRLGELISQEYMREMIELHSRGSANKRLLIWSLLSLESWLRQFDVAGVATD
jgi:asparagine synthase (glutamine-hydrolysing)